MAINRADMSAILRPGVEAAARWAEWAREHPDDPEVIWRKAEAKAADAAYRKRIAYLDACVKAGVHPIRGGENL